MAIVRIKLAAKQHPPFDKGLSERLLTIMSGGAERWNAWRRSNPDAYIDLRGADLFSRFGEKITTGENVPLPRLDLHDANLSEANLARLDLTGADLSAAFAVNTDFRSCTLNEANLAGAYMTQANLTLAELNRADLQLACLSHSNLFMAEINGANLRGADLSYSHISRCEFVDTILAQANLEDASLRESDLSRANLEGANLTGASLVEANLANADLDGCRVFGTSVWKTNLDQTRQTNLIITPEGEPELTADNLKVAQFIYLILNNQEIREVIDTITSKVVLVLGRFTDDRKATLDAVREQLRHHDYIPVLFDFTRPSSKSFIGTIKTLASMTRFVIADLTDARVVIQEIDTILHGFPGVPIQPVLLFGQKPPSVILDYTDFDTFLDIYIYKDKQGLIENLMDQVIAPAERKINDVLRRRERLREQVFSEPAAPAP